MALPIDRGEKHTPARYVLHGPEGVGKSTLAAQWPHPVFIDTEGGTSRMNVDRLPKPTSVPHFLGILNEFKKDPMGYKTLVIDTIDWLQDLFVDSALGQTGLKSMGWTKEENAYNVLYADWNKMLDALSDLVNSGIHVVLVAHSDIKERKVPEEFGAYDHYQLKLIKGAAAKVREWAEYLWFVNMRVFIVKEGKDAKGPGKATDGTRMIYTVMHPCWSAKSKSAVPAEIPYRDGKLPDAVHELLEKQMEIPAPVAEAPVAAAPAAPPQDLPPHLLPLRDLMKASNITPKELMDAIAAKKHFPATTPIRNLPADYVQGDLIANWDKVVKSIKGATANV